MTRLRLTVLVLLAAAFLSAPLGALCSACCVPEFGGDAVTAPTCCGDTCGPSFTAARDHDPAAASAKAKLHPPLSTPLLLHQAADLPVLFGSLPAISSSQPTESPPVSSSVLRL